MMQHCPLDLRVISLVGQVWACAPQAQSRSLKSGVADAVHANDASNPATKEMINRRCLMNHWEKPHSLALDMYSHDG